MSCINLSFSEEQLSALREKAYRFLDEKRIPHVRGCEEEAAHLAQRWGESHSAAAAAGILHDCTKRLKYEEQLQLIKKYDIVCDASLLRAPKLLHAVTGAALAELEFSMPEEIVRAIRWHTTGRPAMSLLEKIIYLADYIEPGRDFPGVQELRKAAYEDLNGAMALGLRMSLEDLQSRGTQPHPDTQNAYDYYINNPER